MPTERSKFSGPAPANDERSHAGPLTPSTRRDELPALADAMGWMLIAFYSVLSVLRIISWTSSDASAGTMRFRRPWLREAVVYTTATQRD
jgi:hypothetical protein